MTLVDRSLRTTFDEVAATYHHARPSYPRELIQEILETPGLPSPAEMIEVGCGTGQASILFAEGGHRMLCLEPGANLAAAAVECLRKYSEVHVECVSFEDWPLPARKFDLLISAQAFHWVDPAAGLAKAAAALRTNGHIALFWNIPQHPDSAARRALDEAYQLHAPELAARWRTRPFQAIVHHIKEDISHTGLFHPITESRFPWSKTYHGAEYLQLLSTYAGHRRLPESARLNLFRGVAEAIEAVGGSIEVSYDAVLYRAMVRQVRPVLASK